MPPKPSSSPPKNFTSLPPDLIIKVFTYLPVADLPSVALTSRRFKILVYNDAVYEPKLKFLGIDENGAGGGGRSSLEDGQVEGGEAAEASGEKSFMSSSSPSQTEKREMDLLSTRLKQLPGGHLLPINTTYLQTGAFFSDAVAEEAGAASEPASATEPAGAPLSPQINEAGVPDFKTITIGAGGLKAIKSKLKAAIGGGVGKKAANTGKSSNRFNQQPSNSTMERAARETFRQLFVELKPYFMDFRDRQRDSKLFKDYKDLEDIATILRRLRIFGKSNTIANVDDINFSLDTTIEWFESMILGQFEAAYDKQNIGDMRRNALVCYQLNGGAACVQLFISKNPIFFDENYNPTLVAAKMPSSSNGPQGYALADEFASFMDHLLGNCRKQMTIISQIFPSEMDAMTSFLSKVFEDCINEYLSAVLACSKEKESLGVFLYTVASCVHCCTQLVDFLGSRGEVDIRIEPIKKSLAVILKPNTERYVQLELEFLQKRVNTELEKINKARQNRIQKEEERMAAAAKLNAATTSSFFFSPFSGGNKSNKPQKQALLGDAEPLSSSSPGSNGSGAAASQNKTGDNATYHIDDGSMNSQISLEFCLHILHINKESLGRVLVVTAATDMSKIKRNVERISAPLYRTLGDEHIKPAFANAIERLSIAQNSTLVSPDGRELSLDSMQFFELVHIADLVSQMIDTHYNDDVKCWIDENDFMSELSTEKKTFERLIDDEVAAGMDKSIQVLINHTDIIMEKELLPTDYNPPGKGVVDIRPTKACVKILDCINAHTKFLTGMADKHTLEVFHSEIAVRLFNVVVKAIKTHQISQDGALRLICDLNKYYDWAYSLRVTSVTKLFTIMKELGGLFIADGGEELRDMVHDSQKFQGQFRLEEILELLSSRADYKKIQKYIEAKDCVIQ